ncbi:MAG: Protein GrpE [candidate division WS2 bacterium]|uniref:Protein GrpE n=1 Tax=Psychracetigena formicireducens TaxID=2986056 RepID=A0A9E2F0L9_PSYF1|nr:Protein GrpE [Candidatus Psychracetigena formicireducens]MBT9144509.1 Protein GrpE [Candidatus Psychracetigena formicireducens]
MTGKKAEIIELEKEKNECLKDLKDLQARVVSLEKELEAHAHKYQKAIEDWQHAFQVIKRESSKQKSLAIEQLIHDLIPFIDSLEEAVKSNQEDYLRVIEGICMMQKNLQNTLEKHGLICYGEIGDTFNPEKHEVLSVDIQGECQPNSIIKIYRKGYLLGNAILKPALVSISGEIKKKE